MDTLLFWLVAAAMTAVALGFVLPRLVVPTGRRAAPSRSRLNADLLRAELVELGRDLADGRLGTAEFAQAKQDLERRLLDENADDDAAPSRPLSARTTMLLLACVVPVAAVGLYFVFGEPAALDAAHAAPAAVGAGGDMGSGRDELARHVATNPRDARAWVLLARAEMNADRFAAAAAAYASALALPKVGTDAGVWCEYADAVGMAQGGRLDGKPRELIEHALALDARHPKALEMAGSAAYERRDYAAAVQYWQALLPQLAPDSTDRAELAAAIASAQRRAQFAP